MSRITGKHIAVLFMIFALLLTFSCAANKGPQPDDMRNAETERYDSESSDPFDSVRKSDGTVSEDGTAEEEDAAQQWGETSEESKALGADKEGAAGAYADESWREQIKKSGEKTNRYKFVSSDIYFSFDSATLKYDARNFLRIKADWLLDNPYVSITIEGHCDERGTNAYNLALGERRAESARKFLLDLGVSPDRIETTSYGEEKPVVFGHNEAAWAKNRRIHFEIGR